MSVPGQSTHVRLSALADARLEMIAASRNQTKSAVAADLLEAALLGVGHGLIVAVERYQRAGIAGKGGE